MAHDDNTKIFGKDVEFAELFEELDKKAKNSFIIFQSDHGIRTGPGIFGSFKTLGVF